MYISLSELFQFTMVVISIATFVWMIATHINKKK